MEKAASLLTKGNISRWVNKEAHKQKCLQKPTFS